MGIWRIIGVLLLLFSCSAIFGQVKISGQLLDSLGQGIADANIRLKKDPALGAISDRSGKFSIILPNKYSNAKNLSIIISHISYQTKDIQVNLINNQTLKIKLKQSGEQLEEIEVIAQQDESLLTPGLTKLDPFTAQVTPSPFQDFNAILATLPSVQSNNELSSTYSVRGGSFDENVVYVNGIPVYRPQLIKSGQQEGLSFVNADMVGNIAFSAGGWQPLYGDKLSSVLNIEYRVPQKFGGSFMASMLGGSFHIEGASKNGRLGQQLGVRYKDGRYLLNTLQTEGQYFPKFWDIQSYTNYQLDKKKTSSIGLLLNFANNDYQVIPSTLETEFGTLDQPLRFNVYFEGLEQLRYQTFQSGIIWEKKWHTLASSRLIISGLLSREQEDQNIEGAYQLCEVDGSNGQSIADCYQIKGIGSNFQYARNRLAIQGINIEKRITFPVFSTQKITAGIGYSHYHMVDKMNEYAFSDSADFVTITHQVAAQNTLNFYQLFSYLMHEAYMNEHHVLTYGARFHYHGWTKQFVVGPSAQYALQPDLNKDFVIKAAAGLYHQPPFFRDLRWLDGSLNEEIKAQSAWHGLVSADWTVKFLDRKLRMVAEAYYKHLFNINPYDINNVRIRYAAENNTQGYAVGMDFKVSGEFVKGAESWFSLGILSTKEKRPIDEDYIPRPADQLVNFGIFFQDHIPNDPTIRMSLKLLFGSGLPFGPPDYPHLKSVFRAPSYRRVDIGLFKIFLINKNKIRYLESIQAGVEILNVLGVSNTISYTWVEDVNQQQFAVPNTLSERFLNIKIKVQF